MNADTTIPVERTSFPTEWTGLASLIEPQPWMQRAACAETDPDLFFPEKGGTTAPAKKVCASCEVREQCLAYALQRREQAGIYGGLSERERRRLTREAAPLKMTADRERKLREMSEQGFNNVVIAEALGLSSETVGRYRRRLGLRRSPAGRRAGALA